MENASEDPNAPGALMLPPGEIERWVRDFHTVDVAWLGLRASQIERFDVPAVCMQPLTARDKKRGEGIMAHPWVAGRRDWLDEIQAQLDKDFKCELEAMALAPPRERGKGKLSFQTLSHFVEEAIVARDWLE